jgi:hypothetical protein
MPAGKIGKTGLNNRADELIEFDSNPACVILNYAAGKTIAERFVY